MRWITREKVKVDRVACPWLIRRFIDPQAEFLFVPADKVIAIAQSENAIPYDVDGVELGHHGRECSFDAIIKKYDLMTDPALILLAKIVNGADTDNSLWNQPEGPGLNAIAEGFRHLGFEDDMKLNRAEWIIYDALYAYCQEMIRRGNRSHGTTAVRGWRERVARFSMQIVEHNHGILEADFDLWNPNHGILPAAGHLVECLWPGKTDPFRILRGLRGRGIEVRDVRQGEEKEQCDSYFG